MLFYTAGSGLTLCPQFSLHKNWDCKHCGCLPKNDTQASSFSLWCRPVYLEMKSELICESFAPSFSSQICFVVNLLCSAFNLKKKS